MSVRSGGSRKDWSSSCPQRDSQNGAVIKRHHLRSGARRPLNNGLRSALSKQPMRQLDNRHHMEKQTAPDIRPSSVHKTGRGAEEITSIPSSTWSRVSGNSYLLMAVGRDPGGYRCVFSLLGKRWCWYWCWASSSSARLRLVVLKWTAHRRAAGTQSAAPASLSPPVGRDETLPQQSVIPQNGIATPSVHKPQFPSNIFIWKTQAGQCVKLN